MTCRILIAITERLNGVCNACPDACSAEMIPLADIKHHAIMHGRTLAVCLHAMSTCALQSQQLSFPVTLQALLPAGRRYVESSVVNDVLALGTLQLTDWTLPTACVYNYRGARTVTHFYNFMDFTRPSCIFSFVHGVS